MREHSGIRAGVMAAAAAAVFGLTLPAYGQPFSQQGVIGNEPVWATATFTAGPDSVEVTITNLQGNPVSIVNAISDIFFTATQGGVALVSGTGYYTPTASYINIAANGTAAPALAPANDWLLSSTSGVYHLDALCGPPANCGGPSGLIIGPGPYTGANNSIAGNDPHNPFIDQTATFTLALLGATAQTVIDNVIFSFGTSGAIIPIPAAVWLFISGLIAVIGIARRKQGVIRNALPAAA